MIVCCNLWCLKGADSVLTKELSLLEHMFDIPVARSLGSGRALKAGCCLCNKGGVCTKISNGLLDARGSLIVLQVTKSCISLQLSGIIWPVPEKSLCEFLAESAV